MLLATVATEPEEAARHTMPPVVMHSHMGHHKCQSTAVVSTGRLETNKWDWYVVFFVFNLLFEIQMIHRLMCIPSGFNGLKK